MTRPVRQQEPVDFIADNAIWSVIEGAEAKKQDPGLTKDLLAAVDAAAEGRGLPDWAAAGLLVSEDPELERAMFAAASAVKQRIYGNRVVLFAPLYISNFCVNSCTYCGYRCSNNTARRRLSQEEIASEVRILEEMGHKRLALEAGEDQQNCPLEYVLDSIHTIYNTVKDNGMIRRVNVNIAATTVEDYRRLKDAGIGTYILFQETYHKDTYARVHPKGPKHSYEWHTWAMDRAMQGGIDDVGIGVLFGLYDHRYELLAMLRHAQHLMDTFGVGPHTISVPRLRPAAGVSLANYPYLVPDAAFKKIVAILRLAVPYTGLILSTREKQDFRRELLGVGISQMSAGSCTGVGGYQSENSAQGQATAQFAVDDHRSLDEVVGGLLKDQYLPSFCTACYRQGRTGDRFMRLAKTGQIQNVCQPNALMTLQEYLLDYASPATRAVGDKLIKAELTEVQEPGAARRLQESLDLISQGKRDLYY